MWRKKAVNLTLPSVYQHSNLSQRELQEAPKIISRPSGGHFKKHIRHNIIALDTLSVLTEVQVSCWFDLRRRDMHNFNIWGEETTLKRIMLMSDSNYRICSIGPWFIDGTSGNDYRQYQVRACHVLYSNQYVDRVATDLKPQRRKFHHSSIICNNLRATI